MTSSPTDIVMLTHNRLDHLVATVDALEARTRAPYRLTIVDNASGPLVRNWLSEHQQRFHQVILRPRNDFLPALNDGIRAVGSDPFMVTDPDLIVPDLDPCWLTRMLDVLARHPDFGLLGVGLDQSNLPAVQSPEFIAPSEIVDGEIVERPVGSVFTLIRRAALRAPYATDWETCRSVARAGFRYGWMHDVRAHHLGWDDFRLHPGHLASKLEHGEYREVQLIERAPTLPELAVAGPVAAVTRGLGVADAAVLELTWTEPAVAAGLSGAVAVERPHTDRRLPFEDRAAGAVVLVDPPETGAATMVAEACRVAAGVVIAIASLSTFGARTASELAPAGWSGQEAPGLGDVPLALAAAVAGDAGMRHRLGVRTLDDREEWLALFAAGAFGEGERRLWIWKREDADGLPDSVRYDPLAVRPWRGSAAPPGPPRRTVSQRGRARLRRELRRSAEVLRIRAHRIRALAGRSI